MHYKSHLLLHNPKKKKLLQLQLVRNKISLILYLGFFCLELFIFFAPILLINSVAVKIIRDFSIFTEVYLTPEYSNNMRSIRILYTVHTN